MLTLISLANYELCTGFCTPILILVNRRKNHGLHLREISCTPLPSVKVSASVGVQAHSPRECIGLLCPDFVSNSQSKLGDVLGIIPVG